MSRFADNTNFIAGESVATLRRLGRLFSTILILSLIAIWLIFAGILYESYQNEWKTASLFVSNVDALLEQDIARNIEVYDLSLKAAAAGYADPETMKLPPKLRRRVLFDQSTNASGLGSILLMDEDGTVIADSRAEGARALNVADQDYFKVHVDGKFERELFVSHPFENRLQPGMWTIGLSRRLDDADGSFGGIVLGTIKLSFFAHLFGSVNMPPGSTIAILHDDGTVLVRAPFTDIGRDLKDTAFFHQVGLAQSGYYRGTSAIDGVDRLCAFRRVGRLPITLIVGIPTSHFMESWFWRIAFVAVGFFILSGLILVLAITLGRELHRRTLAEQSLSDLAATDGLTALANRRHFDDMLSLEWSRAIRENTSVALLMVDGDFFKAYNDTYGHLQGDQALRAMAQALRDSIRRPTDLVARFGGEEFAVLLPGTDLDGALRVGEMIIKTVGQLDMAHSGSPFGRLSVSIGAAACLPTEAGRHLSLVEAADFALYEAKEGGRDRIATGERLDLTGFGWRAAAQ